MERAAEPSRYQFLSREATTLICLFPVWTRRLLDAVSESCCSPAKENRLTGAKVIGGLDTALQTSLEFTTSRNCSVELKKIPDNSVEWGRKHRLFD